jgi:PAS domain S-box-containing protein
MTKPRQSEPDGIRRASRVEDAIAEERARTPDTERFTGDPETMQALLAALVESSDDAIIAKDLNGVILAWNAAAERIFGYRAEEVIGLPVTILLPPDRVSEEETVLATLRSGRRIDHSETERVKKDGTRLRISLSVSPIRDPSGRIVGAAKIARDVTSRYLMEQERDALLHREQQARLAAESANRAKDAFLATVSHELRTPLSPIIMWTRMLRDGLLDATKTERALSTIERNASAQAQLVDDLLDVSRIVSGKIRLEVRPTDLAAVIQAAVEVVRPAADAKGIHLSVVLDTETGLVAGDPDRLQQVVWNLLSNAIKFTPKQGRVHVVLERVNSHVEIAVSDTGEGFDPSFRIAMFDRFQQADSSSSRQHGGLGLGLAIVRHIVELHGGTVHAESAGAGQGAAFTVKLPLVIFQRTAGEAVRRHPTLAEAHASDDAGSYARLDGVRILVVDDEPDSNEAVSSLLGVRGAEVRVAGSAAQAMDVLQEWLPQLIVTDIGMPGEDGFALLAKIRAGTGRAARVPAIALTAYATRDDRLRVLGAGFQLHLSKPIDPAELVAGVANVVQSQRRG